MILLLDFLIKILIYIIPMYIANSGAMLFGGKTPFDLNIKFIDGKPIFGPGKTFKGTSIGIGLGTASAFLLEYFFPALTAGISPHFLLLGFALSIGAILGDMAGSFFKRRNNIPRGTEVLFLDQLDFVIGGMILGTIYYLPGFWEALLIGAATIIIHKMTNYLAFKIKLKKVPW
ncbi:MAG: CDP-2,3-bis-(O-geranylgeranyl)-sn-glycerol synthase [Candidatus Diapherotrites archaeon]